MQKARSRKKDRRGALRPSPEGQQESPEGGSKASLQFTRLNWALLGAAAIVLVVGFTALGSASPVASTVVAPLLLVVGYGALIPLGLIL